MLLQPQWMETEPQRCPLSQRLQPEKLHLAYNSEEASVGQREKEGYPLWPGGAGWPH
jgi:hypothetical protein